MNSIKKLLKEAEGFQPKVEPTLEEKQNFLDKQIEGFRTQYYRLWVDIQVGKRYIDIGENIKEDGYVATGEEKIKESVQHMRSILVHLEKLVDLREKLGG